MSPSSPPSSNALVRKSEMELMAPPPPAKRIKRPPKVLDEDTYTDALSEIIARDFFPGLHEAKHQQDYLNALDSSDPEWIASASRKLTEVMTTPRHSRRGVSMATPIYRDPSATPRNGRETSNPMASSGPKPVYERDMSLDAFQSKYTSEDNESFNKLLDKQNQKRREAHAFLWNGNKVPGAMQIAEKKRLAQIASGEREEKKSIGWTDDRKAMPNTWKSEPRNSLMFTPDLSPPPPTRSESEKELPPKSLVHANTRMPPPALPNNKVPASPSTSAVRDAIAGRPRPSASESGASFFTTIETPRVNGYSFVADAPSPSPSDLGAPPMTWGTITSITPADGTPSPFNLAPTPRREALHHRMVDRVAKGKRFQLPVSSPSSTPVRTTTLGGQGTGRTIPRFKSTPALTTTAGQRLWSSIVAQRQGTGLREALTPGRREEGAGKSGVGGGRVRWTPTPMAGEKR